MNTDHGRVAGHQAAAGAAGYMALQQHYAGPPTGTIAITTVRVAPVSDGPRGKASLPIQWPSPMPVHRDVLGLGYRHASTGGL